jgi:hypothetical protein
MVLRNVITGGPATGGSQIMRQLLHTDDLDLDLVKLQNFDST